MLAWQINDGRWISIQGLAPSWDSNNSAAMLAADETVAAAVHVNEPNRLPSRNGPARGRGA